MSHNNRSATEPLLPSSTSAPNQRAVNTRIVINGKNALTYSTISPNPIVAIQPVQPGHATRPGRISGWRVVLAFLLIVVPMFLLADLDLPDLPWPGSPVHKDDLCPQENPLYPVVHAKIAEKITEVYETPEFLGAAIVSLSGAVQIAYVEIIGRALFFPTLVLHLGVVYSPIS